MAKKPDMLKALDKLAPEVRAAFLRSLADLKSSAQISVIVGHLEKGNIDAAMLALNLNPAFFQPLDEVLRQVYRQGGADALARLPRIADPLGGAVVARFGGRNPRAEAWLAEQSSRLITGPKGIIEEIRRNIRPVLVAGMEAGANPRTTALSVVGRVNRATGRREGGLIGLTDNQIQWTQNAYAQLRSGDPAELQAYLGRKARDRRFDPLVRKAIREGKPVPADKARKMMVRYEARLLKYRGDVIARTETLRSLNASQDEALRELVGDGKLKPTQVKRIWDASGDSRTRDSHRAAEETSRANPSGLEEGFQVGGYTLKYPGDPNGPASETIQCRCVVKVEIDFYSGLK